MALASKQELLGSEHSLFLTALAKLTEAVLAASLVDD